jgi:hypothetical protein
MKDAELRECQEAFDRFIAAGETVGNSCTPHGKFDLWTAFKAGWWEAKQKYLIGNETCRP